MRRIHLFLAVLMFTLHTANAQRLSGVIIKTLSVAGPVVGGDGSVGRVELTAPVISTVEITLATSDSRIGRVPASVLIGRGQREQAFTVKTEPVASRATVTLTARMAGSSDVTATFTVVPPSLTILDCEPKSVTGGSRATCKAWMSGVVARGANIQLQLSSSDVRVAAPVQAGVSVPPGNRWVTFEVTGGSVGRSASATISAVYAGVTVSSSLTITASAISTFSCLVAPSPVVQYLYPAGLQCHVTGGNYSSEGVKQYTCGFLVRLTGRAPSSGYAIPLTITLEGPSGQTLPFESAVVQTLDVHAYADHAFYPFQTSPTQSGVVVKVSARDPLTNNSYPAELIVEPPHVRRMYFRDSSLSGIPAGGKDAVIVVTLKNWAPDSGIDYDATYRATTDVEAPARVHIRTPDISLTDRFTVKIFPCTLSTGCEVAVTLDGVTATIAINR
jgi:hypothetical protein